MKNETIETTKQLIQTLDDFTIFHLLNNRKLSKSILEEVAEAIVRIEGPMSGQNCRSLCQQENITSEILNRVLETDNWKYAIESPLIEESRLELLLSDKDVVKAGRAYEMLRRRKDGVPIEEVRVLESYNLEDYEKDCSCHNNPPCGNCVDWGTFCEERRHLVDEEPGCPIVEHDCK